MKYWFVKETYGNNVRLTDCILRVINRGCYQRKAGVEPICYSVATPEWVVKSFWWSVCLNDTLYTLRGMMTLYHCVINRFLDYISFIVEPEQVSTEYTLIK